MCVARKSGPGREYSVAVDWRDCAWSPRIVVRRPVAATPVGRIRVLPPNATRLERGCVQSTSRSTLKRSAASGVFQPAGFAKLLRLVPLQRDTAAFRGQCANTPSPVRLVTKRSPASSSISPPSRRNRIYF
jgi:hypothetical protein